MRGLGGGLDGGRLYIVIHGVFLTQESQWIIQWECEGEVRIIFFRMAILKTQTPHSNCLYQWEFESEYWERFLDIFLTLYLDSNSTLKLFISVGVREWVLREVFGYVLIPYLDSNSALKLFISVGVWEWVLRLVLECVLNPYLDSNSALKLDDSVGVWEWVLREVLGYLLTPYPDSNWII